ncbi:metal ABC transporter substrate-binding protein [Paenibacillus sp. SYP-B4298]|uniref:metal ABC transporter substrate-binding protein n=1 Tax=Paenibacillus sp. SYP-B4298 TaxID=2996034 RepID=UPI0022DD00C3|nr:metal ABC transporter substrate-binding protein [Paenibacillus sp. SYP-B4298]
MHNETSSSRKYKWLGSLLLTGAVLGLVLAGCSSKEEKSVEENKAANGRISVVTSFYPIYYLASQIGGEQANVINLIPAGVEPHDWTPKSKDLSEAAKANLFLYNGAGLEGWVDDFLKGLGSDKSVQAFSVSDGIPFIEADGSEHEHSHGHSHEEEADHGHEGEAEHSHDEEHSDLNVDPHTWVSPKSALAMASNIKNMMVKVDEGHAAAYEANYEQLKAKLESLDQSFTEQLGKLPRKDIVVSHQAFGYLARDYGLNQVAIMGLSPDAEPRAQDLLEISKFVKEHGVRYIFFEELVSSALAETLAREAKVETLVLNPIEGLTPDQEQAGEDFISLMESNLQHLVQALQ